MINEETKKRTEAQKRAERKYLEKFDDIKIRIQKGKKEIIKKRTEKLGLSINAYIQKLIEEDLK